MVESSPSCQRRPPCKTNKGMSDEAADAAALTYLLTFWPVLTQIIGTCIKVRRRRLLALLLCLQYLLGIIFFLLVTIVIVSFFRFARFLSLFFCLLPATRGSSFSDCSTPSWYSLGSLLQMPGQGRRRLIRSRLTLVKGDLRHDRFLGGVCSMHLLVPFVTSVVV